MVRVPHHDPEPALREPQGLELVETVDGSKGLGPSLFDPVGLRGFHQLLTKYPQKDLTGAENVINLPPHLPDFIIITYGGEF